MHTQIQHSVRKCLFPYTKFPPWNETQRFEMLPVRTHTKMAAIHHGFLFGFGFLFPAASSFSMASKAATLTPGLFCVNKSFGTSTAMRDRRQRRHWQLLSSSCWSSLSGYYYDQQCLYLRFCLEMSFQSQRSVAVRPFCAVVLAAAACLALTNASWQPTPCQNRFK